MNIDDEELEKLGAILDKDYSWADLKNHTERVRFVIRQFILHSEGKK